MRKTTKHGVRHGQKLVVDVFGTDVTVVFDTKSDSEHVIVKRLDGVPLARQAKNMSHLVAPASWTNPSPGYYAFPMEYFHRGDGEWRSYSDVGREGEIRDRRMLARVIDQLGGSHDDEDVDGERSRTQFIRDSVRHSKAGTGQAHSGRARGVGPFVRRRWRLFKTESIPSTRSSLSLDVRRSLSSLFSRLSSLTSRWTGMGRESVPSSSVERAKMQRTE